jgi:hypothetical protein
MAETAALLLTKIRRSFAARLLIFLLDLLTLMPFLLCFSLCLLRDYLRWRWESFVENRKRVRKEERSDDGPAQWRRLHHKVG